MRVLLVEDSRTDAALVREHLADAPSHVLLSVAETLGAGVAALAAGEVDCVLLDLSLPGVAGLDGLGALEAAAPGVPVIVLTEPDAEPLAVAAVRAGAHGYLVKGEAPAPALLRALRQAVERAPARPSRPAAPEPVRVFLCDDVPDLRSLLRAFLEEDGVASVVGEAADGADLAAAVDGAAADVVLLDLSMPDVDGLEAIAALRAADHGLGIIVLSGFEQARMEAQALALGADRYLEKRAGMAEVRRTVAEVAAERRETSCSPARDH